MTHSYGLRDLNVKFDKDKPTSCSQDEKLGTLDLANPALTSKVASVADRSHRQAWHHWQMSPVDTAS
ncbi:hypothetical protein [Aeromonas sobria]|uniref:hypothetical protein n=1 Tax=Aeromonas sobria TaxID=646 RepID=UPI001116B5F4|nr:hypothetical protein [Aeromonas sobria]TNH78963.1 hypothetical protein CF140_20780 [Aeromonas sobria]